jgi:hypothetical protein
MKESGAKQSEASALIAGCSPHSLKLPCPQRYHNAAPSIDVMVMHLQILKSFTAQN